MAGTKKFEPERALGEAMDLFWSRGYEATSVRDLMACMGIGRGSLYDTFGDKHALFLAALDRYEGARASGAIATLDAPGSARGAVRSVFERTVRQLAGDEERRGCLLANSAVELAPHDPEVAERVSRYWKRTEDAFHRALVRAQASGEIPEEKDPRALALFLHNALQGLRVTAKAGATKEGMTKVVDVTFSVLDP